MKVFSWFLVLLFCFGIAPSAGRRVARRRGEEATNTLRGSPDAPAGGVVMKMMWSAGRTRGAGRSTATMKKNTPQQQQHLAVRGESLRSSVAVQQQRPVGVRGLTAADKEDDEEVLEDTTAEEEVLEEPHHPSVHRRAKRGGAVAAVSAAAAAGGFAGFATALAAGIGIGVAVSNQGCTFSVTNSATTTVKCVIFNGKDTSCLVAGSCEGMQPGETKTFGCQGQGENRCKIKCDTVNYCSSITPFCGQVVTCGGMITV